ncbi:HET-domain-containing protein [Xylaria bambusicola]|uniref:HET-domain-containing protein n=1 Tax=Xylaria bambusicola TaxID=326684 RepID=UPI00200736B9|nr:HET-domain-containing protein [Xylaria bambusicola]KAI0521696.1 HET-domain-containing protein [Xylaria bambusicola]
MDTDPRSPVCLAPHFAFLPIDSNKGEIRLLKIELGRYGEVIKCSYRLTTVTGDVQYETLSYVWGDLQVDKTIIVEDTEVGLTDNLFNALTRIRHETELRHLWVDALCINQEDGAEKTAQVDMMHKIFSECAQCYMWMGNIEASAIGVKESEALEAAKGALDAIRLLSGEDSEYKLPPSLTTRDQRAKAGNAIKALFQSPWWSRIWTVQEATSPRLGTVLWGPISIPWHYLTQVAERLIQGKWPPEDRFSIFDLFENYNFLTSPMLALIWASRWIEAPHPPYEMLYRFRYRRSTDPRDKVYVILNLVAEGSYPLPSVRSSDYGVPAAVLYRRVMLDLLRDEYGLRPLIGFRGEPKSVPGLPSWVVDWSTPPAGQERAAFWEHIKFWYKYTADRGLPMLDLNNLTSPEHGEDVLNVNGVFFDKILVCSDVIAENDGSDRLHEKARETITRAVAEDPRFRIVSEVYWQAVLDDIITGNCADSTESMEGSTADVYWRLQMLRHQRLFITEGGAAGLGPSGTSVGDEIWVLSGGRSPFLLGPLKASDPVVKHEDSSYHYSFRGDVFIPGIMRGEAVDSRKDTQRYVHIH